MLLEVFCKAKKQSIRKVMEVLDHFTKVTGMIANMKKSNIFIARVDEHTKKNLLNTTRFSIGTFSIRYLGLPLSSKK